MEGRAVLSLDGLNGTHGSGGRHHQRGNGCPPLHHPEFGVIDTLHWDIESAADADLTKVGLDVYSSPASNPRVTMAAYRINDGSLNHWQPQDRGFPAELKEALLDPNVEKWGFNSQFERVMTRRVLGIPTPRTNWRCSMVLAYMQSFTGNLAEVGEQIGLPVDKQKGKDGKRLIRKFSMPQRLTKNQPHLWRNWITDPEDWDLFCEYNKQDVIAEEAIKTRLIRFPVPDEEWEFYELDQLINDRGIPVDMDFIDNVIWMSARRKAELSAEMAQITGLYNPNSVSQLLPWLQDRGYPYADLQKESVEKALKRCKSQQLRVSPECRKVMELRQWASKTSTSKAITAKLVVGSDNRARYLFQFAGASRTNRFSGRHIQSQNMTVTPKLLDAEESDEKLTFVTDLIRAGDYDGFELVMEEPMLGFTGCMRSLFRAEYGNEFMVCDYSSVESAGLGWVSGCGRLLEVFHSGRDPYKDFGTMFYQKPYEAIDRAERQICKPPTLGCGYRLSAGKEVDGVKTGLLRYAENWGVEMTLEQAERAVKVFREGYPEIPAFWTENERAIKHVLTTHRPYQVGPVTFEWMKPYMLIRLPSGRFIYYYKPRLEQRIFTTGRFKKVRMPDGHWVLQEETYTRTVFTYMGRNQRNNQWTRLDGHGGVTTENIVQALTRDILRVGLTRLHDAGFYVIGHSHDEGMSEVRIGDNEFTLARKRELMIAPIDWAPGFPLSAAGWKGAFYRK